MIFQVDVAPGGYSTLGWVRMCGPKFRPPPYNKTREDANLQPITKPFASWRTLLKSNQNFLPNKLGCISTFWQPIGKLKGKIQRKLCILQKCDLYLNQFSNKKGPLENLRDRKSTLSGPHIPVPTFPLSTPLGMWPHHIANFQHSQNTLQVTTIPLTINHATVPFS